ncbi:hypothetical protein [Brucella pseudogrignonensis]|uniref:Uncharacterized protein n=1 Tax=Brucella pseudogrignonensis TaxID=419475 RepID=A0ABU1MFV5_9HYPH|nr:hypothetical protein [Brucella pseudogrignonensis]MDR6434611.1 hypothetical protein [Brucella pseudogrignonensis]
MIRIRPKTIAHFGLAAVATFYVLELANSIFGPIGHSEASALSIFIVFYLFLWIVKNLPWVVKTVIRTAIYAFIALNVKRFFFNRKA